MNLIDRINELHEEAMDLAEEADRAKKHGDSEGALALFRRALALETQAADETPADAEPTRSILYRSAATLALDSQQERDAEQLALKGLAGLPPSVIADELRDVLEQARKHEPQK